MEPGLHAYPPIDDSRYMVHRTQGVPCSGISRIIEEVLSPVNSRSVLAYALDRKAVTDSWLPWSELDERFFKKIENGLRLFGVADVRRRPVLEKLRTTALRGEQADASPHVSTTTVIIQNDGHIVTARNNVRRLAQTIGFSITDQVRIATIVSELTRNILIYCGTGEIQAKRLTGGRTGIEILACDHGPGISNLDQVLSGKYRSESGMGLGLVGCKRLSDELHVETGPEGTKVRAVKYL